MKTNLKIIASIALALPALVQAIEDPPNCAVIHGGLGNTSTGGINFSQAQAHVGDVVPVFPSFGMVSNACRAINATGSIWIATGRLTNFLINVTLDPGSAVSCPANGLCRPGPYNVLITPGLVGAGVSSPNGSIGGAAKAVRAVQNGEGTVQTGATPEMLADFHTAIIAIVTPCIQVFKSCPTNCTPADAPIAFTGYVTNCGDIRLTNVTVVDSRTAQLFSSTPPFLPLVQPLTLDPGQAVGFQGSFTPTLAETCAGIAASTITVRGTDTTIIGGPNASVTNSVASTCSICVDSCLRVSEQCNGPNSVSAFLTNCGNVTLTNIVIQDNLYGLIGLVPSLAPANSFSVSKPVTDNTCGVFPNIVTASGSTVCGVPILARSCRVTEAPCLRVTKLCTDTTSGQPQTVSGVVTNCGNNAINNISISDSSYGSITNISSLAAGASAGFSKSFTATPCGTTTNIVTALGTTACGSRIQASATNTCFVSCAPVLMNPKITGGQLSFSFTTVADRTNIVQYTDSLLPVNWQPLTNFMGDGSIVTITDSAANPARFYRIWVQYAQPYSATQPASPVTTNAAKLNGMAVPNGQDSVAWFEWGENGTFSKATPPTNVGSGFGVMRVSATIFGLIASRYYSCRLVVSNAAGLTRGLEQRFVTGGKVLGWGISDGSAAVPGFLRDAVAVASFGSYGLALRAGGNVVVWGPPKAVVNVSAGLGNVVAIAAGNSHSLALRDDGTVVSWGSRTNVPAGLSNVIALAAGGLSMALKADGKVVMWATDGSIVTNSLSGLSNVVAIAAGTSGYLALKADGTVAASGGSSLPAGLTNIVAITAGGQHNLALRNDGTLIRWGQAYYSTLVPIPTGLSNVVAIAVGGDLDFALKSDSSLAAWGYFVTPSQEHIPAFVPAEIGSNVCAVACGSSLCLALRPLSPEDFIPYAHTQPASPVTTNSATLNGMAVPNGLDTVAWFEWGTSTNYGNTTGLFSAGNGTSVVRLSSPISGLATSTDYHYRLIASNAAGVKIGFGSRLTTGRKVSGWGTMTSGGRPQPPPNIGPIVKIASGHWFGLALTADGRVVAWGTSYGGVTAVPANLTNAIEIAGGASHALAIREDRTIVAWGSYWIDVVPAAVPAGLSNVVAVAGGDDHTLALKADGTILAWGNNSAGQTNVPTGLNDVIAISAGFYFSVALRADGTVVAWGDWTKTGVPLSLSKVVAIAGPNNHTLALKEDGKVVAWPNDGQTAARVPSGLSNVVSVAVGVSHSLALKSDGIVAVWGENFLGYGQTNLPIGLTNVVAIASADFYGLALAPNVQPQATNASATGLINTDVTIALPGSDPNNDPFTARVSSLPANGALYQYAAGVRGDLIPSPNTVVTDAARRVIFAPAPDAFGAPYSSFGFVANDGELDSTLATMSVNIIPPFSINAGLPGGGGGAAVIPFGLSFAGFTNLTYRVWASTNLVNWSVLGSATQTTPGIFQFTDLASTNRPSRFYRVSSP